MKTVYVCYATSNEYAPYTGISLLSLLENNTDVNFGEIFILDYGIQEENKEKFESVAEKYKCKLSFIDAGTILEGLRAELGLRDFAGSLATYSRAFISYIMPEHVRYLLYVDSDTVVCGSVRPIIEMNLGDTVIAGALGVNQYGYVGEPQDSTEMNLQTGNQKYLQCGVVYYDIQNWRDQNCDKLIADTCKLGLELKFADQSLINNALPDRMMTFFSPEYNYWGHCYPRWLEEKEMKRGGWYSDEQVRALKENPIIIHYKGLFFRPWLNGCVSSKKDLYLAYKAMSPWKDVPQGSLKQIIKSQSFGQRVHLQFGLAYTKSPNQMIGNLIMRTKKLITSLISK